MPRQPQRRGLRTTAVSVTVLLLTTLVAILLPVTAARAAGTLLFANTFNNRTVDGTGSVTVPTPTSGTNVACLTASGNSATLPLLSCAAAPDPQGGGKLRLTNSSTYQVGGVFGQTSFPTSNGLDVTFNAYQWGGGSADGIAFMLAAVDPANPAAPVNIASAGGALGYSAAPGISGLTNAYLGVGLDVFGNFSSNNYSGTGCPANIPGFGAQAAGTVAVRGPGSIRVGYCGLTTTYDGTVGSKLILRAATRAASVVPVEVLINPTVAAFTANSGVSVAAGTYKVVVTPVGVAAAVKTLSGPLPTVAAGLYPSPTWLNTNGAPKQLAFGFVGSTGSVTDAHEVSNVNVLTFNPVPQLAVSTTSYTAATPGLGAPVTYTVNASVLAGSDELVPISVTQTVPIGVVPVGAYGTGWVCLAAVARTVTCNTSATPLANGTTLPPITVVAIVTGAGMTAATVQNSSPSRASSADANPGIASTTTAGVLPTAPGAITVTPSIGAIAGGGNVVVGGTDIAAPTAIEIGTATEQQGGTPVVLLPCPGAAAAGCFTVSGGTLVISSMRPRVSAATVTVTVVTAGLAAAGAYVYADKPATPATPVATAGITSATLAWVAPAINGSAITGYVVTPYLAGVLQTALNYDASTTSRTLTGLTAAGSYTFTVAAINAYGTSVASAPSVAVIAYALPAAPAITAVTAGSASAVLTWSAPSNNGSAINGYLVTPYIGASAQTTQSFTGAGTTQPVTGLTPATAYTFTVAAVNAAGTGPASLRSATVTPNVSPSLTFLPPPVGEVGVGYNQQLVVINGTLPFVWSVSAGTLPAGLTLGAGTGLLSGIPTAAGSFPFTVKLVDLSGQPATEAVTLVIAAVPTVIFNPAAGEVGIAYSQQPTTSGGTAAFAWSISAGSLPAGLGLSPATGLLGGIPTVAGSYSLTVAATDAFSQVATRTVTVVVAARPAFATTAPPAGQVGVAYSTTLDVTGGAAPLAWSLTAGSLPPGLALIGSNGVVSGIPTTVGNSPFTVQVADANGVIATKPVTLVIGAGPLVIVKSANVSSAAAGSTVAYTITITNTGPTLWTGATVTDPLDSVLDDATYNANVAAATGAASYDGSAIRWTGNLAANGSVVISYSVTVNKPDLGDKILANTVTSPTLGTNCAAGSSDARCSATVTVPGLTIVKTADVATATPGTTVHFTVVVTNTGPTLYNGATLTDSLAGVLDDASYNADAAATLGSVAFASPALTWTGNLDRGATATITYSVTIANPGSGNRSLTGTIVSASPGSPCPASNPAAQCSATVSILIPALSISNTANVPTTTPGSTVVYTMTLANTGQTAYGATSATLDFTGVRSGATYNADGAATAGVVTYASGTRLLTWTGDLAIGATVTVTASVTVLTTVPQNQPLTTVVVSAAAGSSCPGGSTNPSCASIVTVLHPELTITKSADASTATPGSAVHYTDSVTNTGQTPYTAATFGDALAGVLDDASYNNDAAATAGAVSYTTPVLTWTGALAIGATATITYSVTVNQPDTGNQTLVGGVTSTSAGNTCPIPGTAPGCSNSVTVLTPGLSIVGTATPATVTPRDVVHYSVLVTNTGQTSYTNLAVTLDPAGAFDDASYNNDAKIPTGGLVIHSNETMDWVLNLAPGASAIATMSLTVKDPDTGNRSILITARSEAPGSTCTIASHPGACDAASTVLVPGLTITKVASASTAKPGDKVTYTISLLNNGETPYPAATFTDNLSTVLTDATYGVDATASTGIVGYAGSTLSWSGALAPAATATITYSVTVQSPDQGDKHLSNTVVSTSAGSNCGAGSIDARCTAAVNVLVPDLTIVKTAGAATTTPGATVTFTVKVTNSGPTPYVGTTLSDSLVGVLDDASYNNDATATSGSTSFATPALSWTGDLAIGATATITYSVTVNAAAAGNNLLDNTVTSSTPGNNCPVGGTDPRCRVWVPVARLVISQSYPVATATPGSVLRLTATFSNTGEVPYTGVTISSPSANTIDDAIVTGDQTATSGTLVLSASAITWTGNIPVGGIVTVTGTVTVRNPDLGNRTITGTLVSSAAGNNCQLASGDILCTALVTVLVPELTIVKRATATSAVPGDSVGYTITISDTGPTPYTAARVDDSLAAVLDHASYNTDAAASGGSLTYASPVLTWTGDLAAGTSVTISYSVTVKTAGNGDSTMINSVASNVVGSTCPPDSANAACGAAVAVLTPALTIVKTADVANTTLGSKVTYTITVTNSGQTAYTGAAFTDSLAAVLDHASYNANGSANVGAVTYAAPSLSWSGDLTVRAAATITYSVTTNSTATGDSIMNNTVVSSTPGANCLSGSVDSRCTAVVAVTAAFSVTVTKIAAVQYTVAGAVVHYSVTVTNSAAVPILANFTDPLGGVLDDATYNTDASANGGSWVYSNPNLTWSGTVPAGGTVTVTYTVTVHSAITGDQFLSGTVVSTLPATSTDCLSGSNDPRCTSTVPIARLLLVQSYTPTTTTPGSDLVLKASFTNTGTFAYNGIAVKSLVGGTLDDAIPNGDETASSGTLTLSATDVSWTGDIPVGGVVTLTGSVTVDNPDKGDKLVTRTLEANVPGGNCPSGGTDSQCTALATVLLPELTISKSANTPLVTPGAAVGYTITIANTGQTAYSGATVTDSLVGVLDDATYNENAAATSGAVTYDRPTLTLTWTGNLPLGATATVTYTVTALARASGDKTMINPVDSKDVGSTCPPASGKPECVSTVAVLTQALTITSTASVATTLPGDIVTYTIIATNTGQIPYAAANLSVPLGGVLDDAVYTTGVSATAGSVAIAGPLLTWTGPLGLTAAVTITYSVTVDKPINPVTGDFRLAQTVNSTTPGNTCPAAGSDPRCATLVPIASLQIANSTDVTTTQPTGKVLNTVTFRNSGQVPYFDVSLSDSFVGSRDDATYNGDATTSAGSLILETGTGRITWTGDLPVGAAVTVTGSLTVNNPDRGDSVMTTLVSTTAPASNCPVGGVDPLCATSVTVLIPHLTITKRADVTTAAPGTPIGYTITVTNEGPTTYTAATVTDSLRGVLADATLSDTPSATSGSLSYVSSTLTWTGALALGQIVTIHYGVVVNSPDLGGKLLLNEVSSDAIGATCTPIAPCLSSVAVLVPVLDIAVTADRTTTVPGGIVGYIVTIANTGQTAYLNASVTAALAGVLDDAGYAGGASTTSGVVGFAGTDLTWTGNLAIGMTATVTYGVTVADPDAGNHLLSTSVTSLAAGSSCGNRAQCANAVTVLIPGLVVNTTADVATATPGDPVVFTITLTNTGQTPYDNATLTADLSSVLDDATFDGQVNASIGVASYIAPVLSWAGTLHVGDIATLDYTVIVRNPDPGNKSLSTTAAAAGSSCPGALECTATVTVLTPSLVIQKSADVSTTTPGGKVRYTITVTNAGQTDYAAATVSDSLSGIFPDASYNADATVVGGGVTGYNAPTLTWTGALLQGATRTITYSITVHDPDSGDKFMTNAVTSASPGSSCPIGGSLAACSAAVRVLVPRLAIVKTADTTTVTAGSVVHYSVIVTNTGQTDYAPAVVSDSLGAVLDDATFDGNATAGSGSFTYTEPTLTWTGALAIGATTTISYSVTTLFPVTGNRLLTNTALSPSPGANCPSGADPACTSTVTVLVPALQVSKSVDTTAVVAGGTVHYTLSATNTGQADYPVATLTDSLAGLLDDGTYGNDAAADSGTVSYTAPTLTWAGSLTVGSTVRITYSVLVSAAGNGDGTLGNRVISPSVASTCLSASTDPGCVTSTIVAPRSMTLSGLTPSFTLTGLPNTTITADGVVTMTVTTNSPGGYAVTVQPSVAPLAGAAGNPDTIPITSLLVRESGAQSFVPLRAAASLTVHSQGSPTGPAGDAVSNDYQVQIPFVASDTYSTSLDYIAGTQ